jgi:hypothetical protein
MELDIAMDSQKTDLRGFLENKEVLGSDIEIKREYNYYKVAYDPTTRAIKSFEIDETKYRKPGC